MPPKRSFRPLPAVALAVALAAPLAAAPATAQSIVASVPLGAGARAIAVDASSHRIYVANEFSDSVTVVDGATQATSTVPVGRRPQYLAADPATGKVLVTSGADASLSVIDGRTLRVTTLPIGANGPIAIHAAAAKAYVVRLSSAATDEVTVVDTAAWSWSSIATGSFEPVDIALDAATNTLYVANYATGDVRALTAPPASDYPPSTSVPVWSKPVALAANPATNKVYVINEDSRGPINVIDGATLTAVSFAPAGHAQGPRAVAVDPATNEAYAAFAGEVIAIDGTTDALTFIPTGTAVGLAVDAGLNRVYAPDADGTLTVIDGATHGTVRIAIPAGARAIAVDPSTHRIYVAGAALTVLEPGAAPPPPAAAPGANAINVQGLWWRSPAGSETGWGLNLTQQGDTLFATWFTYDADGSPLWLVMPDGARAAPDTYQGTLYRTTGPAFNGAFDPSQVRSTAVGSATLAFSDANTGTFTYVVNGVQGSKPITRELYASPAPTCAVGGTPGAVPNYQDLWWASPAASESGWGVNITHQGDILFLAWFTYGVDGKGLWLVGPRLERTGGASYAGTLYRTAGPPFDAEPWNPRAVTAMAVGTVSVAFSGGADGVMRYTVDGVAQSKSITRERFAAPPSACR